MRQLLLVCGLLACDAGPIPAQDRAAVQQLVWTGQLADAERLARAGGDSTRVVLAEVLIESGRLGEAQVLLDAAVTARANDWRTGMAVLAELAHRRGDIANARRWASDLVSIYRRGSNQWTADDHVAAGRALRILGENDPDAVREALAAFDAATSVDDARVEGRIRAADLFLERYNAPDAAAGYRDALAKSPNHSVALLGMARVSAFQGNRDALTLAAKALAANQASVAAWVLTSRLALEAEQFGGARLAANNAVERDSTSLEAWAALAAVAWARADTARFRAVEQRVRSLHPRPAAFYAAVAEAAGRVRRYADGVRLAAQGVALDSTSSVAWGALGTNKLRTGDMAGGRAALEHAFARDPFHVWYKNTLDLLDQVDSFRTVNTARFQFVAPARDAALLGDLLGPLLEEAYDSLVSRYQYRPPTPVRMELYDRHADFSVRTVGLTGLGALGVSFGTVLAMDAPSARSPGEFNFGSTAWHELAHTFTLGASDHRVPRWLSEGLSVLEERRARPGWGAHASVEFVQALHKNELLPVARLNEGFVRPETPGQLGLSYYQASLVCELIERDFGMPAIRTLLAGYAQGLESEAALRRAIGISSDSLDVRFNAWLRTRFARPLAAIAAGDEVVFGEGLTAGTAALASGDTALAVRILTAARDRFPEYGGADGPSLPLAVALNATGERDRAISELSRVTTADETAWAANRAEARWRLERHDSAGALAAWQRVRWILPSNAENWRDIAALAAALRRYPLAIEARRMLLGLSPSDPIAARTDFAEALLRGGQAAASRRELLSVLELAPSYERAQGLLLEARQAGGVP